MTCRSTRASSPRAPSGASAASAAARRAGTPRRRPARRRAPAASARCSRKQIDSLQGLQDQAAQRLPALANGTATDPTTAVMAVERAQLSMQLASQLRTKGVEAINDVFHTQV